MAVKPQEPQTQGRKAEQLACRYLQQQGLKTVTRNYRCRFGEIDLVMLHGQDCVVFIEVRYRKNKRFGTAAESIDMHKQTRLRKTAKHFLLNNPKLARLPCRFDVVAIQGNAEYAQYDWLRDAF